MSARVAFRNATCLFESEVVKCSHLFSWIVLVEEINVDKLKHRAFMRNEEERLDFAKKVPFLPMAPLGAFVLLFRVGR